MKILREPLVHFVLAGAVLFAAYSWVTRNTAATNSEEPVHITEGDVQWITETWSKQWLRQPNPDELRGLINDLVDEELFAREALEMGLEKDDTIVRRRLAQKLKFLVADTTHLVDPSDTELRRFYEANLGRYQTAGTISFTQVFFNAANHKDAEGDAKAALAELQAAGSGSDLAATMGDQLLLDPTFQNVDETTVSNIFGPDFARDVFGLKPGVWSGPIKSGYGLHLVLLDASSAAQQRPFEEVRDQVLKEWWAEKEDAANRDYMARLREKYGVVLDDAVAAFLDGKAPPSKTAAAQ